MACTNYTCCLITEVFDVPGSIGLLNDNNYNLLVRRYPRDNIASWRFIHAIVEHFAIAMLSDWRVFCSAAYEPLCYMTVQFSRNQFTNWRRHRTFGLVPQSIKALKDRNVRIRWTSFTCGRNMSWLDVTPFLTVTYYRRYTFESCFLEIFDISLCLEICCLLFLLQRWGLVVNYEWERDILEAYYVNHICLV